MSNMRKAFQTAADDIGIGDDYREAIERIEAIENDCPEAFDDEDDAAQQERDSWI